jgi:riboflavin kinase/FMN adenylyltransferase
MSDIKRAIALGFFDGVHIGHGALLNKTKERAAEIGAMPSVLSFDVHPDNLVFGVEVPLINSAAGRKEIIRRCYGIDNVVFIHFNKHVMQMPWEDFAADIIDKLNIGWIVCGHDFTFGHKGQGNALKLKAYCEERGIGVDIISAVQIEDLTVSSTHIRTLVAEGNMEEARRYLGHPHCLVDTVHSGYHLGTKMGTPTINMRFPDGVIIPRHGVYAAKVYLEDGTSHVAVTNIGVRPTVSDENTVSVESHLLDYSGNLYGSQARVEFYSFIRPEMKFADFRELGEQIKRDAETAREYFKKNS